LAATSGRKRKLARSRVLHTRAQHRAVARDLGADMEDAAAGDVAEDTGAMENASDDEDDEDDGEGDDDDDEDEEDALPAPARPASARTTRGIEDTTPSVGRRVMRKRAHSPDSGERAKHPRHLKK
jgi:hypothetical protein